MTRLSLSLLGTCILGLGHPALAAPDCGPCDRDLPGDYDGDGDIDGEDLLVFLNCVSGPGIPQANPNCAGTDFDGDGDSDQADFGVWQIQYSGACDCLAMLKEPPTKAPAATCDGGSSRRDQAGPMRSVYLFSGEVYEEATDLVIKGRGLDLVWARKYRSRIGLDTAMGKGWDFSYNLSIERVGQHIRVHNGNARYDLFRRQDEGTWAREELFQVLASNPDGTYTLTFPDTGKWNFAALDGSPAAGKIATIQDRNGNTLSFTYDASGRLITIHDSLDTVAHNRDLTVSYDAEGFIESVTDFTGRQVRYQHYQDGEAGGSPGDLKSARSPLVNGTPNGNDFPVGKTTVYTYSKDLPDERLNHNLLTITDPEGQTFVVNTYAATVDPGNLDFDRILTQQWGDPGEHLTVAYTPQTPPGESGSSAVIKAAVTDRNGNVKHYFYDAMNRLVVARELTRGLRPGEPAWWETRWSYNADSLPTEVVYPNGNSTLTIHEFDLNPAAPGRLRGNLRQVEHLPGPLGGDQASISESFTYEAGFGGCEASFVKTRTDGRGNVTTNTYDAAGNRIHTDHPLGGGVEDWTYNSFGQLLSHTLPANGSGHRRLDTYSYYAAGPQNGYLQSDVTDSGGFNITTTYQYDAVGNLVRKVQPSGADTLYTYNALDQVVREQSPEVAPGSANRYEKLTWYDADDNVIRTDVQNKDETGAVQSNTHWSTLYEYDTLSRVVRVCRERGTASLSNSDLTCASFPPGQAVTTEYQYDANGNRTLVRSPMAVNGTQVNNTVDTEYDERNLVFRVIRALADPLRSTSQTDYDGNGQVISNSNGLESGPQVTTYTYDGYERRTATTDAMGNVTSYHYDADGNRVGERIDGELYDLPGGAGNVRLSETFYAYDAMNRQFRQDIAHFDTQTQAPIGDGFSTTQWIYADNSQVISRSEDNPGHVTTYAYDTANRRSLVADARGNTFAYAHDADDNVVQTIQTDKSDLNPGIGDQTFTTTFTYDGLDRPTSRMDNLGNTYQYAYDSRNNRVLYTDARNSRIRYEYDGLSRLLTTGRDMNANGVFTDPADIVTGRTWDDSSRLTGQTDDNGNTTVYQYDPLDRPTGTVFADCTTDSVQYDVYDNAILTTDANNSLVSNSYDQLNRVISKTIVPGPGISADTLFEIYAWDGLSRLVRGRDDDSLVSRGSPTTSGYDSLSNVLRETQWITNPPGPPRVIAAQFDGESNPTRLVYPGGRMVVRGYDLLGRLALVRDDPVAGLPIASYARIGSRPERRDYANSTRCEWSYDGLARVNAMTQSAIGGAIFDQRAYVWDALNNKLAADQLLPAPAEHRAYTYDAANRLVRSEVSIPPNPPAAIVNYVLDGAGNRLLVTGGINPGFYSRDWTLCEPADSQVNQYTTLPGPGGGSPTELLDEPFNYPDGNLAGNGTWTAHSAAGLFPVQVSLGKARLAQGPSSREDVNTLLSATLGAGQKFYAAFDLTNTGGNGSVYFAHFKDAGTFNFAARVFITSNGLGDYTIGLSGSSPTIGAVWPAGLTYGTTYRVVTSYEFDTGEVELWVNPVDQFSPSLTATGAPGYAISAYALRQATPSTGTSTQTIANLCVSDSFSAALNCDFPPGIYRLYDNNGNLTSVPGSFQYAYDYRNRLVQFTDFVSGQTAAYRYDCLGRRIEQNVNGLVTRSYYDGWQEIEEQDAGDASLATYVWGTGVDELLQMARSSGAYYYHADDLGSVMKVTDAYGYLAEGYAYADYGKPSFFDRYGYPISQSTIGNPYLFADQRYDAATGWYYMRMRYLDPIAGRFTTRDVIGLWGDTRNLGSGDSYVGNNPTSCADPFGLLSVAADAASDAAAAKGLEALADKCEKEANDPKTSEIRRNLLNATAHKLRAAASGLNSPGRETAKVLAAKAIADLNVVEFGANLVVLAYDFLVAKTPSVPISALLKGAKLVAELKKLEKAKKAIDKAIDLAEKYEKLKDAADKIEKAKELKEAIDKVKDALEKG